MTKTSNERRIERESAIARKCVRALLAHGYAISVCDGEEITVKESTSTAAIFAALATTDEDVLYTHKAGCPRSFVQLIYGNDCDLISDHGVSLQPIMDEVHTWTEKRFAAFA